MVTVRGLKAGWMILNELLGELKSKSVFIPNLIYADMRNSKMVLEYLSSYENENMAADSCDDNLEQEMELQIFRLRETLMMWT